MWRRIGAFDWWNRTWNRARKRMRHRRVTIPFAIIDDSEREVIMAPSKVRPSPSFLFPFFSSFIHLFLFLRNPKNSFVSPSAELTARSRMPNECARKGKCGTEYYYYYFFFYYLWIYFAHFPKRSSVAPDETRTINIKAKSVKHSADPQNIYKRIDAF